MVPKLYHLVFRTILANIHSVPTLAGMPEVKEPTSTDRPTKAVSFCFECRAQPIQRESLFNELIRLAACSCNSHRHLLIASLQQHTACLSLGCCLAIPLGWSLVLVCVQW